MKFIYGILQTIYSGFVLSCMWLWFMTPLGLPVINIAHAVGLICIGVFFRHTNIDDQKSSKYTDFDRFFIYFIFINLIFLYAYIAYRVMPIL